MLNLANIRRDRSRDSRYLEARLNLVVDSLTATIFFNPAGMILAVVAIAVASGALGRVPVVGMATAIALQLVIAVAAWFIKRHYTPLTHCNLARTQWVLVGLQACIGLGWGSAAWLLWDNGDTSNNLFVCMLMLAGAWAATFTRASNRRIFLTGISMLILMCITRFATAEGVVPKVLLGLIPFWLAYIVAMGSAARHRVSDALAARFENEDLSAALQVAHDDALRKRNEAEAANASKTAFLANMSHELRTPLNAILGFSDIIAAQAFGQHNPCYQEYARDIHVSGTHLLNLINDILDVAKIESGKMEIDPRPLDVFETLAGVERLMALKAREKHQHLKFTIEPDAPMPMADARAFKQIVLNLVSNALKFTPEGGYIDVFGRSGDNGGFLLAVEDTGPGIPRDKLDKVFQAFSQVDNRYDRNAGGTGLGLALVQGLARLHNGRAWIESELGCGAKVFVYFPLGIAPVLRERSKAFG